MGFRGAATVKQAQVSLFNLEFSEGNSEIPLRLPQVEGESWNALGNQSVRSVVVGSEDWFTSLLSQLI